MDMNSVSSLSILNQYTSQNNQMQNHGPRQMSLPGMESSTQVGLSGAGQMMSMDSESRAEMHDFHETVMSAIESGEFDAEVLAENAPQALKDIAEAQGKDLTSMIEELPAKMENMPVGGPPGGSMGGMEGGRPSGPPPSGGQGGMEMGGMQGGRPAGPPPGGGPGGASEEMDSFLDSLVEAAESGESDISSLTELTPDEVTAIASELGMEVDALVSDMLSRIEENGDPREQDPSTQRMNQQGIDAYSQQMGGGHMRGFMDALLSA